MCKRSRSKANIPIPRESLFWIPSPVSCLNRPSCPACRHSTIVERALQIVLFLQNKPNSLKAKTNVTSYARNGYTNIPLRFAPKNKPKQSQSPQRNTRYATRNTKTKPDQTQFQTHKQLTQLAGRNIAPAVRPKCIIPIHTFSPEKYFELLGGNVKLMKDRETVEI